ncbi:hypothetical protein LSH36_599g00005 [Paralvinella palmiformis]|uniref:G-protein coupled receptors family 1 profile domain-containing protein n=1 Tax=Paralvinella palmiformis TaxID=53620 RepID=A0AAD9J4N0_9ANNE|nr:hypothetical protein LSH36_599g00005 [Paralvinella palmiformis]
MPNTTATIVSPSARMYYIMTDEHQFFDTYYSKPRFAVETCLSVVAVLSNATMLLLTYSSRHRRHYAYFAFFRNLLIANVLSAGAQWFTNNLMYLLDDQLAHIRDRCHFMLLLLAANVISKVFGAVSVISLLGLSVIHCLAVCYPIAYVVRMNNSRVHIAIALSWGVTLTIACLEVVVCIARLTLADCAEEQRFITVVTIVDADVAVIMLTLMYAAIVGLCLRIAIEIRRLQARLNRLCWTDNLKQERGTFRSIVGLTITMIAFIFPYHVIYFLSINFDLPTISNTSALLYYMNLLPYVKFATDPIFFCRKRIVQWRNVGCIFAVFCCCRKSGFGQDSREDRALIEENNVSGVTVAPGQDDVTAYTVRTSLPPALIEKDIKDLKVTVVPTGNKLDCTTTSLV